MAILERLHASLRTPARRRQHQFELDAVTSGSDANTLAIEGAADQQAEFVVQVVQRFNTLYSHAEAGVPPDIRKSKIRNGIIPAVVGFASSVISKVSPTAEILKLPFSAEIGAGYATVLAGAAGSVGRTWYHRAVEAETLPMMYARFNQNGSISGKWYTPEKWALQKVLGVKWKPEYTNVHFDNTWSVDAKKEFIEKRLYYLSVIASLNHLDSLSDEDRIKLGIDLAQVNDLAIEVKDAWIDPAVQQAHREEIIKKLINKEKLRYHGATAITAGIAGIKAIGVATIATGAINIFERVGSALGIGSGISYPEVPSGSPNVTEHTVDWTIHGDNLSRYSGLNHVNGEVTYSIKGFAEGTATQNMAQLDLQQHASAGVNYLHSLEAQHLISPQEVDRLHLLNSDGTINYANYRFSPHNFYDLQYGKYLRHTIPNGEVIYQQQTHGIMDSIHLLNSPKDININGLNPDFAQPTTITYMSPNLGGTASETYSAMLNFAPSAHQIGSVITNFLGEYKSFGIGNLSPDQINQFNSILAKGRYVPGTGSFRWENLSFGDINFLRGFGIIRKQFSNYLAA